MACASNSLTSGVLITTQNVDRHIWLEKQPFGTSITFVQTDLL